MSANIYYRPVPDKGVSLPVYAPSHFIETFEKAFETTFPMYLETKDLPVIKGIAAASGDGGNPYPELIEAIEKYGEVELTVVG